MRTTNYAATLSLLVLAAYLTPGFNMALADTQLKSDVPITGVQVPGMASFDHAMTTLMKHWGIPGGALAIVRDGRLVLARGYGYADQETKEPVKPDSLFRIASITKPITAVAILKLAEEGQLDLDDKAFGIIDHIKAPAGTKVDTRISNITIRHLLQHLGGWDKELSGDPMFRYKAVWYGAEAKASCESAIRYMLRKSLDFTPGERYAYSNFGYCVLGRIIERVTGQSYEDYVKTHILAPIGITRMRLGKTLPNERADGEVRYYGPENPYGSFYINAMDSNGGWIASAIDVARFVLAVDGRSKPPDLLKPETIKTMVSRPKGPCWVGSPFYYAKGWLVRPVNRDANWWHTGSLAGTTALVIRTHHDQIWVALLNSRPKEWKGFQIILDINLWKAARSVRSWPSHDLFQKY